MFQIILTINLALVVKYLCSTMKQYIISKSKVEIATLICNHAELAESNGTSICELLKN